MMAADLADTYQKGDVITLTKMQLLANRIDSSYPHELLQDLIRYGIVEYHPKRPNAEFTFIRSTPQLSKEVVAQDAAVALLELVLKHDGKLPLTRNAFQVAFEVLPQSEQKDLAKFLLRKLASLRVTAFSTKEEATPSKASASVAAIYMNGDEADLPEPDPADDPNVLVIE